MKQKKRNIINFESDEELDKKIDKIKKATGIRTTSELLRYAISSMAEKIEDKKDNENS
jgi:metal-responsive CopG/Arc/MetJ family transcriptional regulator